MAAAGLALVACTADKIVAPNVAILPTPRADASAPLPAVRISEFHYDHIGTDTLERLEISGPAGTDLSGWQVVRYNGATPSAAVVYTTPAGPTIGGVIPSTCGARGVLVFRYPTDGLQNGGNDGFALVDPSNHVVELLSYEGVFTASNGPAATMTSVDVGVAESNTSAVQGSIQRQPDGTWTVGSTNTFGACNDDTGPVTPPAEVTKVVVTPSSAAVVVGATQAYTAKAYDASDNEVTGTTFTWSSSNTTVATVDAASGSARGESPGDARIIARTTNGTTGDAGIHVNPATPPAGVPNIRFSEIHYDNSGTDVNEAIEIEGPTGTDLGGWSIVLYDGTASSTTGAPAGSVYGTTILTGALTGSCSGRGTLVVNYPTNGLQNGSPDGFALVDGAGHLVEFLSYEGTIVGADGPASGVTSTDIGQQEGTSTTGTQSLSRSADGATWNAPAGNTFGTVNACGTPAGATSITFSGRDPLSDPPLPVGFEAQIFATYKVNGTTTATTITWSSDTPTIASIDQNGVLRALSAGTAILRATAADGTTATYSLPTIVATMSGADYAGNTEFGDPNDGDPSDDFIIRRPEYTTSFNRTRNTPNWVSFRLDNTNYGAQDRCNCFTYDPELDAAGGFNHITTADYTGAGAFAGYGIDRGHMDRSFDRTAGNLDNATTYYFSNIVPQAADLNQGPWAIMENYLGDLANGGGKQVYVIDGPAGNKGTLKNEGKVVIPEYTWKVAVIMNDGQGRADVHSASDVQVIAVVMPNIPGIRNVDWNTYQVNVDSVEHLSGYDVLALLQDEVERTAEAYQRMDIQPEIISLASSTTVTTYLYSSSTFDATAVSPATIRLRVIDGTGPGAPVAQRGTAYLTSITDANGDGRPDRMLVFKKSDLVSAGLSQAHSQLVLEDLTGATQFQATDTAPARVAP